VRWLLWQWAVGRGDPPKRMAAPRA
jgi:hypothetical protein